MEPETKTILHIHNLLLSEYGDHSATGAAMRELNEPDDRGGNGGGGQPGNGGGLYEPNLKEIVTGIY